MGHRKIFLAGHALVDVAHHHIETSTFQLEIGVEVHEWIVSDLYLPLVIECVGGGLESGSIILCVVAAVNSEIHMKHFCHTEANKKIGIYGEFRQREHVFIRRGLEGQTVIPVEYTHGEILIQRGADHLHTAAVLHGHRAVIEVNHVLDILHAHIQIGVSVRDVDYTSGTKPANFAEIIFPNKVVGGVVLEQIRHSLIGKQPVSADSHRIAEKFKTGRNLAVDVQFACSLAYYTYLSSGLVAQQFAGLFCQLRAYPQKVFSGFGRYFRGIGVGSQ